MVGARPRDLGDGSPPVGSRGKALVGGKAEAKCEISNVFLYKILDLMNIRAGLGEYILQTHSTKFF